MERFSDFPNLQDRMNNGFFLFQLVIFLNHISLSIRDNPQKYIYTLLEAFLENKFTFFVKIMLDSDVQHSACSINLPWVQTSTGRIKGLLDSAESLKVTCSLLYTLNTSLASLIAQLNYDGRQADCIQANQLYSEAVKSFKDTVSTGDYASGYPEAAQDCLSALAPFPDPVNRVWCWKCAAKIVIKGVDKKMSINTLQKLQEKIRKNTQSDAQIALPLEKISTAIQKAIEQQQIQKQTEETNGAKESEQSFNVGVKLFYAVNRQSAFVYAKKLLDCLAMCMGITEHQTVRLAGSMLRACLAIIHEEDELNSLLKECKKCPIKSYILSFHLPNASRESDLINRNFIMCPFEKLKYAYQSKDSVSAIFEDALKHAGNSWLNRQLFLGALVNYGKYGSEVRLFADPRLKPFQDQLTRYVQLELPPHTKDSQAVNCAKTVNIKA